MNRLLPSIFVSIPLVAILVPRGMAALIDGFGLICATQLILQRKDINWHKVWRDLRWIIAALAFIALSSLWSVSPRALEMLRDTLLVGTAAMLIATASRLWPQRTIDRALRWFVWITLLALGGSILHAAIGYPLSLRLGAAEDLETLIGSNIPKRTAALIALLVWPAALCLYRFHRHRYATILLLIAAMLVMGLPSRAAIIGLLAGIAAYGLASILPRAGRVLGFIMLPLAMPLALAFALCLPQLPHDWGSRLPPSGEFRLGIWNFAAHKAVEHLPLGLGIDGSRVLASPADRMQRTIGNNDVRNSLLPDHPHNVFLQLWLEGGIVGAGLTIILLTLLWLRLGRLPRRLQAFAWGYAATAVVTLGIAYGTWQAWWLGGHALAAILLALLCRAEEAAIDARPAALVPETAERPRPL